MKARYEIAWMLLLGGILGLFGGPLKAQAYQDEGKMNGGEQWSIFLCQDSLVWTTGLNSNGQLGDGTNINRSTPVQVAITDVVMVAAGSRHAVVLRADSTVWAWGRNTSGTLGNGTNTSTNVPVQVPGLTDVVFVDAGWDHSLAVKADGTVWTWGLNTYGQLGDNSNTTRTSPVQVPGINNAVKAVGGSYHSLALLDDGTVRGWGRSNWGQVGNGVTGVFITPVTVSGLTNIVQIDADHHSMALEEVPNGNNRMWTWGRNQYGNLGDGTTSSRSLPFHVNSLTDPQYIACGRWHSMAIDDGATKTWGRNGWGMLGNGTLQNSSLPITISTPEVHILGTGEYHSFYADSSGTMFAWARNDFGQLGNGTTTQLLSPAGTLLPCAVGIQPCQLSVTAAVSSNYNGADISCFGASDGMALASITGDNGSAAYSWSTGGMGAMETGMPAGTHSVIVTEGECRDTAFVSLIAPAALTANIAAFQNPTCNGGSDGMATVTAGGGTPGFSYAWIPSGSNGMMASGLSGGLVYTVVVTDANGCQTSDSIPLLDPAPLPVMASGAGAICEGDSLVLMATGAGTYSWDNGAGSGSMVTVSPSATTLYTVTGTDSNGCSNTDQVMVVVNALPDVNTTLVGNEISVAASGPGVNYQWLDCENNFAPLAGETSSSFQAGSSGTYAVAVSENGCVDTSACTLITVVGIEQAGFEPALSVYPNPTKENTNIEWGEIAGRVEISVYDPQGRKVYATSCNHCDQMNLAIPGSAGIYLLQIRAGHKEAFYKLIKE